MKKILLPTLVISLGYVLQQGIPHLARTYTLLGFSRGTESRIPHGGCVAQHEDKFLGCEDMHLVQAGGGEYLFAACLGEYPNRRRAVSSRRGEEEEEEGVKPGGDRIWRWDLRSDRVVELELVGFPGGDDGDDRAWHGFDVNVREDGTLSLYIINHRSSGSVIEKFSHDIETSRLVHRATIPVPDDGLVAKNPNDVYALPDRDDSNAFYVTSDHYYNTGILHLLELYTRRPWSHVAYYSTTAGWRTAVPNVSGANGITGDKKGRRVYLAEMLGGYITVLDRDDDREGVLTQVQKVKMDFVVDNPSLSAGGADLYVAGHVNALNVLRHMLDPASVGSGSGVARISTSQLGSGFFGQRGRYTSDPIVEEVFVDLGGRLVNASTTAVWWDGRAATNSEEGGEEDDGEMMSGNLFITGLTGKGELWFGFSHHIVRPTGAH